MPGRNTKIKGKSKKIKGRGGTFIFYLLSFFLAVPLFFIEIPASWGGERVFEAREIWGNWSFPMGTVVLEEGELRPAYVRGMEDSVNTCLDAGDFVTERDNVGHPVKWGGISDVGSNPLQASNIIDGDRSTGWEPSALDPLSRWWVQIDLGRAVRATKVRLVFSEDGEPFRMFEIYRSTGQFALSPKSGVLDFRTVARVTWPNSEYVVEYNLDEELVRYFYLQLTVKSEHPKLAEFEVYTLGDNIALGIRDREGCANTVVENKQELREVWKTVDGDYMTSFNIATTGWENWSAWEMRGWLHLDLGNLFWVNLIRIIQQHNLPGLSFTPMGLYYLYVSDGSPAPPGSGGNLGVFLSPLVGDLIWEEVGYLPSNPQGKFVFEESFTLRPVRHIFLSHRNTRGGVGTFMAAHMGEFQVFGRGYVPEVVLTSDYLGLGQPKNITGISWEAQTPPGTEIQLRSRTGEDVEWEITYWKKLGSTLRSTKVTREQWEALSPARRGPVDTTDVLRGWSPWSGSYRKPGDPFGSPSPRTFVQLEARLTTEDPDRWASLKSVKLIYTDPVASTLFGEVEPKNVQPGIREEFTYSIRPLFTSLEQGFDEVLIRTPSSAELTDVRIAGESAVDSSDVIPTGEDSLWIRLPLLIHRETFRGKPDSTVRISFQSKVFLNGTLFEAFVGRSSKPGSWQRVDPKEGRIENLTIFLPSMAQVIGDVHIFPTAMTPNGDGIHDEAVIEFSVLGVDRPGAVTVTIHDVRGISLRRMSAPREKGSHRIVWDGTDDSGDRVSPGIYMAHIHVETAAGDKTASRILTVVY